MFSLIVCLMARVKFLLEIDRIVFKTVIDLLLLLLLLFPVPFLMLFELGGPNPGFSNTCRPPFVLAT